MVKRLNNSQVSRVKNKFAKLGDNIVFELSPCYNNILFIALLKNDEDALKDYFDKTGNYVIKSEVLGKFAAALGCISDSFVTQSWKTLEANAPHTHKFQGWAYEKECPESSYSLFGIMEDAYVYYVGKDVEYYDTF